MLNDFDNRILTFAIDALLKDFEPKDAIPFISSKFIFNENQQEIILNLVISFLYSVEFYQKSVILIILRIF